MKRLRAFVVRVAGLIPGVPLLDHLWHDGRYAIRQLRHHAGFTATAILTLALGMGASVAIFAFVDAALLKPLPYRNASRLVGVFETVALFPQSNLSYPDYLDWKKLNSVLGSLDVYGQRGFRLSTEAGAQPATGARVSDGFFRTLGAIALAREIGVRIALGAQSRSVHGLVLGEAGRLIALGTVLGLLCSLAAAALIRGLLFGVSSWDVPTLAGVAVLLGGSALLASYLPARRAAAVDPVEALRSE